MCFDFPSTQKILICLKYIFLFKNISEYYCQLDVEMSVYYTV